MPVRMIRPSAGRGHPLVDRELQLVHVRQVAHAGLHGDREHDRLGERGAEADHHGADVDEDGDLVEYANHGVKTILPKTSPEAIAAKPSRASRERQHAVDLRPDAARLAQPRELRELVARAHRRADHVELEEEHALQLGRRVAAAGGARDDERAAGPAARAASASRSPRRPSRARRRRARAACAPLSNASCAPSSTAFSPLRLVAAGDPHAQAGVARQHDRGAGHAAARALDQHGLAGPHAGLDEQHPVGGQPRGRQARRLLEARAPPAWARGCRAAPPRARPARPGAARTAACAWGRASRRRASRRTRSPSARSPRCRRRRRRRRRSRGSSAAASSGRPTPRSDHRSWWLSEAARTSTVVQPSGGSGSGRSPTSSAASGSSAFVDAA